MSELYRRPTGQVETLDGKTCNDCTQLFQRQINAGDGKFIRYTCAVGGHRVTPNTYHCALFAKVNGWQKLELITLTPLSEEPAPGR